MPNFNRFGCFEIYGEVIRLVGTDKGVSINCPRLHTQEIHWN